MIRRGGSGLRLRLHWVNEALNVRVGRAVARVPSVGPGGAVEGERDGDGRAGGDGRHCVRRTRRLSTGVEP